MPVMVKHCLECGTAFRVSPRVVNKKFCSKLCQHRDQSRRWKAGKVADMKTPRKCKECGGSFIPKVGVQCWCSHRCFVRWQSRSRYHRKPELRARKNIKARESARKWREANREKGLCTRCGGRGVEPGHKTCWECATGQRVRVRRK